GTVHDAPEVRADLVGTSLVVRVAGGATLEDSLALVDVGRGEHRLDVLDLFLLGLAAAGSAGALGRLDGIAGLCRLRRCKQRVRDQADREDDEDYPEERTDDLVDFKRIHSPQGSI